MVMAVGQHVFVNCPEERTGSVVLADESGKVMSAVHLADGVEVEVIAWRPRGASGTRYRVRRPSDSADGWLSSTNLRKTAIAPPAPARETVVSDDGGSRPFGQQSHTERVRVSHAPSPVEPLPSDESRGRRFGQRF